ncbi:MAG TPA: ribosome biogenesis GTPase Der [Bacteroidales bacterium]|nr:ribosome biogenesis GTPase Der [Bacteroidales bacterium]
MRNIVAIVGRPNVGKSTFFNRLIGERLAIVDVKSGVTRDRHYGISNWNGVEFSVIDTGGWVCGSDDIFEEEIRKQVAFAIDEADAIIFMVDGTEGITPLDEDVAEMLRHTNKRVLLVVNKVDNPAYLGLASDFYKIGIEPLYCISSINGSGTGDLLDDLVAGLKKIPLELKTSELPKFTIVGRPNVGKSSFINCVLGEERHIVTPIPGTTRDSIYTPYKLYGLEFLLVDTAGLRKKGKIYENIEFYSILRSIRAIENSDVCLLMIDACQGFESQDMNIFRIIENNRKGVVIIVNKWDLIKKTNNTLKEYESMIKSKLEPFSDVPIVFTSVINKQRVFKSLQIAMEVFKNKNLRISTHKLNEIFLPIIEETPPPMVKGKKIKIKYITQLPTSFPAFGFFCNLPQYIPDAYKRFIENKIRENFNFSGVPIEIYFRKK